MVLEEVDGGFDGGRGGDVGLPECGSCVVVNIEGGTGVHLGGEFVVVDVVVP